MASPPATKYASLAERATIILKAGRSMLGRKDVQALYGAAFVAQVAAWNAYVAGLIGCFFQEVANPMVVQFHAMHTLANTAAISRLDRFNTPNAENTRNLILQCTGYDPWVDWQWPARGMNALDTRLRLNEILKVRHSLAHGFPMPGYSWTQGASGQTRLTVTDLAWTRAFFDHLVITTDLGLRTHLVATYGAVPNW
ncbi:MAG: hypothetical protein Q8O52_00990 [Sulfuritalea sp.]|nr:hypothetical protein [Sulfuritalea sp.]